jgi:hypothetical protein
MGREIERPQPSASLAATEDQGRECGNAVPGERLCGVHVSTC